MKKKTPKSRIEEAVKYLNAIIESFDESKAWFADEFCSDEIDEEDFREKIRRIDLDQIVYYELLQILRGE